MTVVPGASPSTNMSNWIRQHMNIPDFVTHYHLADKAPFQNLSTLEGPELDLVLADLQQRRSAGLKRVFGPKYVALRRLTERRLRELFIEAGGRPERRAPHYFCLGESAWFRGLAPDTRGVTVPLSTLPDEVTSFTYPDSVVSMGFGPQFGLPDAPRPYHGRAFRMADLPDIVHEFGLPGDSATTDYEGYWRVPCHVYTVPQAGDFGPLDSVRQRCPRELRMNSRLLDRWIAAGCRPRWCR